MLYLLFFNIQLVCSQSIELLIKIYDLDFDWDYILNER